MTGFRARTGPGAEPANVELSLKLNEWLANNGPQGLFRSCANCAHMARSPDPVLCKLYGMTPPIDVVMAGCDAHADEADPPF